MCRITQLSKSTIIQIRVFCILVFAQLFNDSSIQLIEYIIQDTTIRATANKEAINVKYLTIHAKAS
jgi:hypothetical protein